MFDRKNVIAIAVVLLSEIVRESLEIKEYVWYFYGLTGCSGSLGSICVLFYSFGWFLWLGAFLVILSMVRVYTVLFVFWVCLLA